MTSVALVRQMLRSLDRELKVNTRRIGQVISKNYSLDKPLDQTVDPLLPYLSMRSLKTAIRSQQL